MTLRRGRGVVVGRKVGEPFSTDSVSPHWLDRNESLRGKTEAL
jgi:hypothetical protein